MLGALQRQAERGIRYFTFKEQTLLNKAEKEGKCRYLTKLGINVLICKGQCYAINVKDFTPVGCDHVERGHWLLLAARSATFWTKQDRCNSDHVEITARKATLSSPEFHLLEPQGPCRPKGVIFFQYHTEGIPWETSTFHQCKKPPKLVPEATLNLYEESLWKALQQKAGYSSLCT